MHFFNWCFVANYKHAARNLDLPIEVLLLLFLSVLLFPGRVFDAFLLTTGIVFINLCCQGDFLFCADDASELDEETVMFCLLNRKRLLTRRLQFHEIKRFH